MTAASSDGPRTSGAPVAIVTGAGSGVGAAIARGLGANGWTVVLVGRRPEPLADVAAEITAANGHAVPVALDVTDADAPARIMDTARQHGRVRALVNNAGAAEIVPIAETGDDLLEFAVAVNAIAPARLVVAAWPQLIDGSGDVPPAVVVNVSSMATVDPFPGFLAYGLAKSGLESVARSVTVEGAEHGVRAWNVAPGAIETAMLRRLVPESVFPASATLDPEAVAAVVIACIAGERDEPSGTTIHLPNEVPAS